MKVKLHSHKDKCKNYKSNPKENLLETDAPFDDQAFILMKCLHGPPHSLLKVSKLSKYQNI